MDRILSTYNYGICLFSPEVLQDFLKREKVRSKKLLDKFQKDKELYLATQKEGIWLPIAGINSGEYIIKLDGYDEPFDDNWEKLLEYGGFNLEIRNSLCISDTGMFFDYNAEDFNAYEKAKQTMDGKTYFQQFKYDIPSGMYHITVKGYAHKQATRKNRLYGFVFSLVKVEAFEGYLNPREDELYEFNVGWLAESKKAVVHWLAEEEGGRKQPPERKYNAAIQSEDGDICHLYLKFDGTDLMQDHFADQCRVDNYINYKQQDDLIYSGAEYILYEETRKRGKSVLNAVGRIEFL